MCVWCRSYSIHSANNPGAFLVWECTLHVWEMFFNCVSLRVLFQELLSFRFWTSRVISLTLLTSYHSIFLTLLSRRFSWLHLCLSLIFKPSCQISPFLIVFIVESSILFSKHSFFKAYYSWFADAIRISFLFPNLFVCAQFLFLLLFCYCFYSFQFLSIFQLSLISGSSDVCSV